MSQFVEVASEIARGAGAIVEEIGRKRRELASKAFGLKGEFDLVTEADHASEAYIVEQLHARFPSHSVVAEEGGGQRIGGDYRWYVDPVDGTTNFAHGFPVYNVTLALERAGEVIAGVIFDPTRNEMFTAERGAGAWLNGDRIAVSSVATIEESLVATGFPSRRRHQNVNVHFYYQLAMLSHGVRRAGAAAIDLAYVACGRLDAFWEFGLNPWDMAAGSLMVEEAGGRMSTMRGESHQLTSRETLATNGKLHPPMLELFAEIFGGRFRFPMVQIGPERA